MTDTRQARAAAWARIDQHLRGVAEPRFVVVPGPLDRLPASGKPVANYFLTGEIDKQMTFGNVMAQVGVKIRAYWRMPASEADAAALELEMWHATRSLQAPFSADRDLGGNVSSVQLTLATTGEMELGAGAEEVPVRTLEFDLLIDELEAEDVGL